MPGDRNLWCKVDFEDKETDEFVKVTLWNEKAELADGLIMFSDWYHHS